MKNILVIEDEPVTQVFIRNALADWQVQFAGTLKEARRLFEKKTDWDAVVLDLQVPDGDGMIFFEELRGRSGVGDIPWLILTGSQDLRTRVMAYRLGVDDFMMKPIDPVELRVRLESKILNRVQRAACLRLGDVEIDVEAQRVRHLASSGVSEIALTSVELKILVLMGRRKEKVWTRDEFLELVWPGTYISDRTVDSHIAHLRKKLEATQLQIETVKSVGYRLKVTVANGSL